MSSGLPKMSCALRPVTPLTSSRAFDEARPEHGVREIGARLGEPGDAVTPRGAAAAEAAELRKDEPHPVALLAPRREFAAHVAHHRGLRGDEAREVEGIVHARASVAPVCEARQRAGRAAAASR